MSSMDVAPSEIAVPAEAVAECCSTACWTVEERAWKQLLPDLPDEVTALLAAPVVVSAQSLGSAGGGSGARHAAPEPQTQPEPQAQQAQLEPPVTPRRASTLEPWPVLLSRPWPDHVPQVDQSTRFEAPGPPHRNTGRHAARC